MFMRAHQLFRNLGWVGLAGLTAFTLPAGPLAAADEPPAVAEAPAPPAADPAAPAAAVVAAQFPALGAALSTETAAGWNELLNQGTLAAAQTHFEAALKDQPTQEAAAVLGLSYTHLIAGRRQQAAQVLMEGLQKIGRDDRELAGLYLDLLAELVPDLDGADGLIAALTHCAQAPAATATAAPAVRARARHLAVNLLAMQGKFKAAQDLAAKQNFLKEWALIGPFDNQDKKGQATAFDPEKGIHFDTPSQGKNSEIRWHPIPAAALPVGKLHGEDLVFPAEQVLLYAATAVKVPANATYILRLGCGGGAKVFLNGKQVGEVPFYSSYDFNKGEFQLPMGAGNNVIMLKLGVGEAMGRGFEFTAQLCDSAGEPLALETASDPALLSAAPTGDPVVKPVTKASSFYESIAAKLAADAPTPAAQKPALLALQGLLTASRNIGNPEDAKYEDYFDQAAKLAPDSLWINFLNAENSRKRNVAILAAQKVLARDPAAAGATQEILARRSDAGLLQLAELQARQLLDDRAGDAGLWQVIIADALNQRGDRTQARQVLTQAAEFRPLDAELWLKHWTSLDTDTEKQAEAQRALHYLGGSPVVLATIADWKADTFKVDEAVKLVQDALTINPQSQRLLKLAIQYEIRAGQPDAALALVDDALKIAPGHPELLQQKGELLRRLHPGDDAVKAEVIQLFQRSLAARPENPQLREYVELLNGKTEDWFKAYDLSPEALKALIVPPEKFNDYPTDNAINLLDQQVIRVNDNGTTEAMVHQVRQVLRPQAIRQLSQTGIGFNADRESVKVLRAIVYDSQGNEIGRGEVQDGGKQGGTGQAQGRIYDDGYTATRVRFTKLEVGSVIDFQYLRKDTKEGLYGNYFADVFYMGDDDPTRLCQYILDLPTSREFKMKSLRAEIKPVELEAPAEGRKVVKFEVKDSPGQPRETNTPPVQDSLPFVQVSTFADWNDVAKWYWQLAKEQFAADNDVLKNKVAAITKDAKTPLDKLKAINNAVIQDIHYVGIELGRNGYKPHRADHTLTSKMGDCKDTATLIASMCQLAGIDAKLVLIRTIEAGENPKDALAAPNLFNHCIAYVPDCEGKAYWLDGTTNTNGLGEVPPSDQGANVLLIDGNGGQWATIPRDGGDKNGYKTTIDVKMNADGSGEGHVRIDYTGFFRQWNRSSQEQPEGIKRGMEQLIGRVFPKATLSDLKVGDPKDLTGPVFYEFSFKAPQIGTRINATDLGLVVEPFPWRWSQRYCNEPERKQDLWTHFQYTIAETVVLHLPDGASIKTKPEDVDLKNDHAAYLRTVTQDGRTVTITKASSVLQDRIKAASYPVFRKWANQVDQLENDSLTITTGAAAPTPAPAPAPESPAPEVPIP